MSPNNPNSRRAARSDAGAASAGKPPEADRAPAGGTGPAVPLAGPDLIPPAGASPAGSGAPGADGPTIDMVPGAPGDGVQPAPLTTETSPLALAAAGVIAETRPQETALVLGAAAGSATEAPSLGAGALADLAGGAVGGDVRGGLGAAAVPTEKLVGADAGLPPGRVSAAGAYGGVGDRVPEAPDLAGMAFRRDGMAGRLAGRDFAREKLALARPETPEGVADALEAGFDFEVTSRQLNFRRAGVVHPTTPTLRRTVDFTAGELELLRSEPMLVVRVL